MSTVNLFEDDWRACLQAHYQHVLREQDIANEQSLVTVLIDSGFTQEQIIQMRREVLGDEVVDTPSAVETVIEPEPLSAEPVVIAEPASLAVLNPAEAVIAAEVPPVQPENKGSKSKKPKQMSLF